MLVAPMVLAMDGTASSCWVVGTAVQAAGRAVWEAVATWVDLAAEDMAAAAAAAVAEAAAAAAAAAAVAAATALVVAWMAVEVLAESRPRCCRTASVQACPSGTSTCPCQSICTASTAWRSSGRMSCDKRVRRRRVRHTTAALARSGYLAEGRSGRTVGQC